MQTEYTKNLASLSLLALGAALASPSLANDWPQWRGPHRDGISQETGLLKAWPQAGPKLVWQATNAGSGYSTPAVVKDRLYLLGNAGLENEFVAAIATKDGARAWTTRLGNVGNPKQQPNFPAARSTPTVHGELLYALGSDGDLVCLELSSGKTQWHKQVRTEFNGKPGDWAYAESPLVDEDRVVCTPGGTQATLLALNNQTGEVVWQCALPESDAAAYASPIVVDLGGVHQYVQLLQKGLVGVEARTGKFLWRYGKPVSAYNANIPSPTASDSCIYVGSAGTGGGAVKIKAIDSRFGPEQLYFTAKLPTAIGGVVKIGDYLYGTTAQALLCVEFLTGEVKWQDRALGAASLCYADGRLYLHGENGEAALVEASPEGYHEKGRFTPPNQAKRANPMEKAWAYPVVANGRLYLRDHNALWCYELK